MKRTIILPFILISSLMINCSSEQTIQVSLKNGLIEKLITESKSTSAKTNQKIYISKSGHCEAFDCEAYFRDYKDEIQVYPKEDLFMRNIRKYIEIESIDENAGKFVFRKVEW